MSHRRALSLLAASAVAAALVAVFCVPAPAVAKGSISRVESDFEKAIKKATPATVVCLPWGVDPKQIIGGSSGVVMSRKGLVLSDGDVGTHLDKVPAKGVKVTRVWSDDVEIRMPNLKGKGFRSFRAKVIRRSRDNDTALLRIEKAPTGIKYLKAGSSDDLEVGDFAFAVGNSFGLAAEAPPTLTAGVIASLVPRKEATGGVWQSIYTSAAVNPGVNGGPLVDIHGRLIGTISSAVNLVQKGVKPNDPSLAYAYLGKVVPVERLRAIYADLAESKESFPASKGSSPRAGESGALATVFHHTSRRAYRSVVSLEIKRSGALNLTELANGRPVQIPRYVGAVSGVLISRDGFVLTSLYNLANIAGLVSPAVGARLPENAKVKGGLAGIESVTVHLPDGRAVPSKLVARHEGIGLALLRAEMGVAAGSAGDGAEVGDGGTTTSLTPAVPAPADAFKAGRFVMVLGNPFGKARLDDPLLTVGLLSKEHSPTTGARWANQWQTDAGITDANSGGAAVDLRGRLLGIATIWSATQHGRNSGIGFIVPWTQIEPYLPALKRGKNFFPWFLGVNWKMIAGTQTSVLGAVVPKKAAAAAGLKVGDELIKIDGQAVRTPGDVHRILRGKWAGDTVAVSYRRGGTEYETSLTLAARD